MGFSPLANMSMDIPAGNRWNKRNAKIQGFTIHHNAGVDSYGEATNPNREVSANYWISNAGDIIPQVDEVYRAWTTGAAGYPAGAESDHRNITVEVSNSPEGVRSGTWAISAAARKALEMLIGDVFKRYNLGPVKRALVGGVAVHQDFVPTACPGPYIIANLGGIIKNAEAYRNPKKEEKEVDPMPLDKSFPQFNPNQKCPADAWSRVLLNSSGDVSIFFGGKKHRSGTAQVAVNIKEDVEFLVRFVYEDVSEDGKTVLKTSSSVWGRYRQRALHAWPVGLSAGSKQRIRVQVKPVGSGTITVIGVRPIVKYWEK